MAIVRLGLIVKRAIGVILLVLGLGAAGFVAYYLGRDLTIWILGRHTPAYVTDKWVERTATHADGTLEFNYYVEYVFETRSGTVLTTTKPVSVNEWGGAMPQPRQVPDEQPSWLVGRKLAQERPIDIIYFPLYPRHNRIDDSRFVPFLLVTYVPIIGVMIALLALGCHLSGLDARSLIKHWG